MRHLTRRLEKLHDGVARDGLDDPRAAHLESTRGFVMHRAKRRGRLLNRMRYAGDVGNGGRA